MKVKKFLILTILACLLSSGLLIYHAVNNLNKNENELIITKEEVLECIKRVTTSPKFSRNTEARLSVYFSYKPYKIDEPLVEKFKNKPKPTFEITDLAEEDLQASRGKSNKKKTELEAEVGLDIAKLIFADVKTPTPETARAIALVHISNGEFDEAVNRLEKATKDKPNNILLLNDLAVAYLARGEYMDSPKDFVYALSTIDEAVAADNKKTVLEIYFNRALMQEKLLLERLAKESWAEYLNLETNLEWKADAQKHFNHLNTPSFEEIWQEEKINLGNAIIDNDLSTANQIVEKYPHPCRIYVIDELLPIWGQSYLAKEVIEAEQKLKIASFIGEKLVFLHGDNLIKDMVKAIETPSSILSDGRKLEGLATAHQFYGKTKFLLERSEVASSLANLKNAESIFSKLGDRASLNHIRLHIARCKQAVLSQDTALEMAKALIMDSKKYSYPYLTARTYIIKAYIYQNKVELSKAIDFNQKAIKILEIIEDFQDNAIAYSNLGAVFSDLKDKEQALKSNYKSLRQYSQAIKNSRYVTDLFRQATQIAVLGKHKASNYFYDEAVKLAIKIKQTNLAITPLIRKATINEQLGIKEELFKDIKLLREYKTKLSDEKFQNLLENEIIILEAKAYVASDPEKAVFLFTEQLEKAEQLKDNYYKRQLYLLRSKAHLQMGKVNLAEEDLLRAVDETENQRKAIKQEQYKISFFEEPIFAYQKIAELKVNYENEIEIAFDYVEQACARSLLDEIGHYQSRKFPSSLSVKNTSTPLKLAQIQNQIPKSIALLEYLVLEDQIFIWVIKKDKTNFAKININQKELNQLVFKYCFSLEKGDSKEELQGFSNTFYKLLIAPVKDFISMEDILVIVPDKELYNLSYASLINPATNKYLLEENAISYSPSATVFINSLKQELVLANQSNKKTLIIGNPTFSREAFPGLFPLYGAIKEAKAIEKIYSNSYLLKEENATKEEFAKLSGEYSTIHFAGHAIANTNAPLYSVMVMAINKKKEEDKGALYAYELYEYNFGKTELVVLAACQTAKGQVVKGEGALSLTRPFLAKGVPSVVASLWAADDSASEILFVEFHKRRNAGENTVDALRNAQLFLLNSAEARYRLPKIWAPFVIFGMSGNKILIKETK